MSTGKKCEKCGFNIPGRPDGLEVEYKDFKTSELLEIRHKAPPPAEEAGNIPEQPGGEDAKQRLGETAYTSSAAKKNSIPLLAVVVILALIIGGIFLARFFILR